MLLEIMNIKEFVEQLQAHPEKHVSLRLPDGARVPAHFHITEVGHVTKRFIDCGGTRRVQETCLLQTWVYDDIEHRLTAGKLAAIFERVGDLLEDFSLPVEIEHELGTVAQFSLEGAEFSPGALEFQLGAKHTDCLARGVCLPGSCGSEPEGAGGPVAAVGLVAPVASNACTPGGGCC